MRGLWNESKLTMRWFLRMMRFRSRCVKKELMLDGASEAPGELLAVRGRLRVFP